jgi:hypothetical protein
MAKKKKLAKMVKRTDFAISESDGHDTEWTYPYTEKVARSLFEELKKTESDIHLYEYKEGFGYEVIDSFSREEED